MAKKKIVCIFCTKRTERSREDIISGWLVREVGGTSPFYLESGSFSDGKWSPMSSDKTGAPRLILNSICGNCNNRWMSRLETAAKPILLPMIRGSEVVLSIPQQRVLAAWAQLKMICYDARYGTRHLPASMAQEFCERRMPLQTPLIAIGRYEAPSVGLAIPHARRLSNYVVGDSLQEVVRVAFAFNNLYIYISEVVGHSEFSANPSNDGHLIRCWPATETVSWPPPRMIKKEMFMQLLF
jgi:hypothetical protein